MWRMRASFLALLLMLAVVLSPAAAGTKKSLTTASHETCNMKNRLYRYLKANVAQVFQPAGQKNAFCQTEWGKFGACCESDSLRAFINTKTDQNQHALTTLVEELQSVSAHIESFANRHLGGLPKSSVQEGNTHLGNGIAFSTSHHISSDASTQSGENQPLSPQQKELQTISEQIHQIVPILVANQTKCVNKIDRVVASSTCSICSTRADDFFGSSGKLKISESLCRSVLAECADGWEGIVSLKELVARYTVIVRNLSQNTAGDDGIYEEDGFTLHLDGFLGSTRLVSILRRCKGKGLQNCKFKDIATLCNQFILIQSDSYIESALSKSQKMLNDLRLFRDRINNAGKIQQEFKARWINAVPEEDLTKRSTQLYRVILSLQIRIDSLTRMWLKIKKELPLINSILKSSSVPQKKLKDASDAISTMVPELEQHISDLSLEKHGILHEMVVLTDKLDATTKKTMLIRIKSHWNQMDSIVEQIQHKQNTAGDKSSFYNELATFADQKQKYLLANKSQKTRILLTLLWQKIQVLLKQNVPVSSNSIPSNRILSLVEQEHHEGSLQASGDKGQSDKCPGDVLVIKDAQCNPCMTTVLEMEP